MITRSYIHEYAPHDQFMCESYYLLLESKDTLGELINLENVIAEKTYFGESVDNEILVLEAEKKNIFTRIGEAVIEIFNSFIDFLKSTGTAIKDSVTGMRKKTSDDKLKEAMAKDPTLAKDFLQAVLSGNIKAHDVKDLNNLIDEATKITNDLMAGKIDKKSHSEKIDEALERFGKASRNIASILGIVGAIATAVKGFDYLTHGRNEERHDRTVKQVQNSIDRDRQRRKDVRDTNMHRLNRMKVENDIILSDQKIYGTNESVMSDVTNEYMYEGLEPSTELRQPNVIKDSMHKIMTFFADHASFCTDILSKIKGLMSSLSEKVKGSNNSEDGETVNAALAGLRKVMGVVTKDLTTIKNSAKKAEEAVA